MPINAAWLRIGPERVAESLQQAIDKLDGTGSEVVLDFSSVHRLDVSALKVLENLAGVADDRSARISLAGVGVEVFKVLKLMNVSQRFTYLH